jgi:hypothetical protein
MTYRGRVKNGRVVLRASAKLTEGMEVIVRPIKPAARRRKSKKPETLYDRLKSVIGRAKGLPKDFSTNHDHYLYGVPKRK